MLQPIDWLMFWEPIRGVMTLMTN